MDAITVRIQTMEPASGLVTSGVTKPPSQLGYFQYENGVYPATALRAAIDALLARDLKVVGLIQHESRMPGRSHCDMELEDIASGERRSEEHTSELQSLMRISYAVFCLKKKKKTTQYIRAQK